MGTHGTHVKNVTSYARNFLTHSSSGQDALDWTLFKRTGHRCRLERTKYPKIADFLIRPTKTTAASLSGLLRMGLQAFVTFCSDDSLLFSHSEPTLLITFLPHPPALHLDVSTPSSSSLTASGPSMIRARRRTKSSTSIARQVWAIPLSSPFFSLLTSSPTLHRHCTLISTTSARTRTIVGFDHKQVRLLPPHIPSYSRSSSTITYTLRSASTNFKVVKLKTSRGNKCCTHAPSIHHSNANIRQSQLVIGSYSGNKRLGTEARQQETGSRRALRNWRCDMTRQRTTFRGGIWTAAAMVHSSVCRISKTIK
jgi:hypothetical protein